MVPRAAAHRPQPARRPLCEGGAHVLALGVLPRHPRGGSLFARRKGRATGRRPPASLRGLYCGLLRLIAAYCGLLPAGLRGPGTDAAPGRVKRHPFTREPCKVVRGNKQIIAAYCGLLRLVRFGPVCLHTDL